MRIKNTIMLFFMAFYTNIFAIELPITEDVVGDVKMITITEENTLPDIGIKYGLGYADMVDANPEFDPWLVPENSDLLIPTSFILPNVKREGIVINLAEYRLYYFHKGKNTVSTYPIGIGREGWNSPIKTTKITGKIPNPSWIPPASILKEHEEMGDPLPAVVKPGPDNPLGDYKMPLNIPGYLIHGTNKQYGIGLRVSHGCFRMDNTDIKEFAKFVNIGTNVNIINQPYKFGMRHGTLYLEVHNPLSDSMEAESFKNAQRSLMNDLEKRKDLQNITIDWSKVRTVFEVADGIPTPISVVKNININ